MSRQLLTEYLDRQRACYIRQHHGVAYTAPEIAESSHINGRNFAKVVMIKVDGELSMVVLPAHYHVDIDLLRTAIGAESLVLAQEREFSYRFPRCEPGAMPPFGHLYGFLTYMVPVFESCREIAFNAGTHSEIIRMPFYEYMRLAHVVEVPAGVIPPSVGFGDAMTAPRLRA